jgi:N-acetyl-anhydromuramoyl-L-alanine amidase
LISPDGWLSQAVHCPSSNFNQRPPECVVDLLVIHNISLPPGHFGTGCVQAFFSNQLDSNQHPYFQAIADLKVSAHLLIERTGAITQFVAFDLRAWHAGVSHFLGRDNCNDNSIGIELEGCDDIAYTDRQYEALAAITRELLARYPAIGMDRIVGHSDIAPGRKTDPGPAFDWDRYKGMLA